MNKIIFLLCFVILARNSGAQLDLKSIMKGQDFIGHWPENPYWSYDGKHICFSWRNPQNTEKELTNTPYVYSVSHKKINDWVKKTPFESYDRRQGDFPNQFYVQNGGIWCFDKITNDHQLIWESNMDIQALFRVRQAENVVIQMNQQLFLLQTKQVPFLKQLTHFQTSNKNGKTKDSTFLEKQQMELFEFIQHKNKESAYRKSIQAAEKFPKTDIGTEKYNDLQISPDLRFVVLKFEQPRKEESTVFPAMITKDGFAQSKTARSKVSYHEPHQFLKIYDRDKDTLWEVSLEILTNIKKRATFTYLSDKIDTAKIREVFIHPVHFHPTQPTGLLDVRSSDNKDRWLVIIDFISGKVTEIEHQHDSAWIGGPGISSWNMVEGTLGWLNPSQCFFQSEETGYSHLYLYDFDRKEKIALTAGDFEIHDAVLSKDKKSFFITANKKHPGTRGWYQLDISTKKWTTLLEENGAYEAQLSPDEKTAIVRYSTATKPWELFIYDFKKKSLTPITSSVSTNYQALTLQTPQVVSFSASDGENIYARLYSPTAEKKNGAAVLFVHGAGYLQNAHHYWSHYHREFLFHQFLIQEGYTVLDVDYRASEGYGRNYRTAIHRHMGGRDLEDFVDAKNWLVKNRNIDSNRVGIYGGSYGGFITLMGLFNKPNEFACGAALRAVTDWAHYNHEYTSNILHYPETDPEAYRKSSPIYFAAGLEKPLLILHGLVDDNVQVQDVIRLSQKLIELEKKNWELALFPVEAHGFTESSSWLDEYRRIFELFEKHLK
jgi:dienelactone hydrolase